MEIMKESPGMKLDERSLMSAAKGSLNLAN